MEQLPIGLNLECTPAGRNESKRFDPLAEFENFGRQTDGFGRVVSDHAVFNRHFGFHLSSFPTLKLSMLRKSVKTTKGCDQPDCHGGVSVKAGAAE
jgi:hypothetical protein